LNEKEVKKYTKVRVKKCRTRVTNPDTYNPPTTMSTARLKRKLGDLGIDTSSRKANENFCLVREHFAYPLLIPTTLLDRLAPHCPHSRNPRTQASSYRYGSRR
jgi:hypothetical protein